MNAITLIKSYQPVGCLYIGTMPADRLRKIITSESAGILRRGDFSREHIMVEPSAVVLSVRSEDMPTVTEDGDIVRVSFDDGKRFAEVLAGKGGILRAKGGGMFHIPVAVLFDLTQEEKWSIQEMLGVSCGHRYDDVCGTPEMECHIIARCLGTGSASPFRGILPMAGEKAESGGISQGVFSRALLPMLTEEGKRGVFRSMHREGKHEVILRILMNYFSAVKNVYPEKWDTMTRADLEGWMDTLPDVCRRCFFNGSAAADNLAAMLAERRRGPNDGCI